MISFFKRTNMRLNGCVALRLIFGSSDSNPGIARNRARSRSMDSAAPATNKLIPSGLSRMVPFSPQSLQQATSSARNGLRPLSSVKQ